MEKRRVQMTGGSSYIITLPKEWVKERGIKKNDILSLIPQPDGSLLIAQEEWEEHRRKMVEIDVSRIDGSKLLFRMLVGAYIRGCPSMIVYAKSALSPELRETVRNFVKSTVGLEIIEEDEKRIEVKDLLSPSEMPFDRTIKRMHMLVKNMHEDAISGLLKGNREVLEAIGTRDTEIDRLYWLIAHQYNSTLGNRKMALKMGTSPEAGVYYFIMAKTIERVGDHAVRIADNSLKILDTGLEGGILREIGKASDMALKIFTTSIDCWLRKDMMAANENINSVERLIAYCESIGDTMLRKNGKVAVYLGNILESIRRTGEYSTDISEMAINYLIK